MRSVGPSDSRTVGLCLLAVVAYLSDSPTVRQSDQTVRQSVRWRPDERSMITDFSYVRALAATPEWLFAATTHGLVIYDRRRHAWQPPVTLLDGYPTEPVRGAAALGESLRAHREEAALFRRLATLRTDADLPESLDDLRWHGARRGELEDVCHLIGEAEVVPRMPAWRPA